MMESLKTRLETTWIRTRGWISLLLQLGAIGIFLVGVYAVWESKKFHGVGSIEFLGFQISGIVGFTPLETLQYGGVLVMMVGLGLAYRWIITGSKDHTRVGW